MATLSTRSTTEPGPEQGSRALRWVVSLSPPPATPARVCAAAGTVSPHFPWPSAGLAFTGLDPLRSRAERGRRVPIPLRKRETIKEEQWSFLPVTPNTKRRQNVARLRAALPGPLLCPLTRGREELQTPPPPLPRPGRGCCGREDAKEHRQRAALTRRCCQRHSQLWKQHLGQGRGIQRGRALGQDFVSCLCCQGSQTRVTASPGAQEGL